MLKNTVSNLTFHNNAINSRRSIKKASKKREKKDLFVDNRKMVSAVLLSPRKFLLIRSSRLLDLSDRGKNIFLLSCCRADRHTYVKDGFTIENHFIECETIKKITIMSFKNIG